jgi:hypothetical protein
MTVPILSSLDLSLPASVGRLAHALQENATNDLVAKVEIEGDPLLSSGENALWLHQEDAVHFTSIEARNQCAAAFLHAEWLALEPSDKAKTLFETADRLWSKEIGDADQASGRFLALANRSFSIFDIAADRMATSGNSVWATLHLIESALPYLDSILAVDLVKLMEAQYRCTENVHAAGMLFSTLEKTLASDASACRALHATVTAQLAIPLEGLYQTSLLALARSGHLEEAAATAIKDAERKAPLLCRLAHWGIALLLAQYEFANEKRDRMVEILRAGCQSEDSDLRATAINSISHAASRCGDLLPDLLKLGQTKDQLALIALTNFIFFNFNTARQNALFLDMVHSLYALSPETTAGLDNFDWILSKLVEKGEYDLVCESLTAWSLQFGGAKIRDTGAIEVFDQTIGKLVMQAEQLSRLLTEWLVADARELGAATTALIGYLWVRNVRQLTFSKQVLDRLTANEMIYLVRRMLGYASFNDESLLSLTFSLMNTHDAKSRTHALVISLLTNEVGRDFLGATIDAIKAQMALCSEEEKILLQTAHSQLTAYANALEQLPRLDELKPPLSLRRAQALKRARDMQESMENANEKSVFRQIFTEVRIKAGTGVFSFEKGGIGETHYLQKTSHAVSIPNRAASDPLNYAIQGMMFRVAMKEKE